MQSAFEAERSFDGESRGLSIHSTVGVAEPLKRLVWPDPAFGSFAIHTWTFTPHDRYTEVQLRASMEGWLVSLATPVFQKGLDASIASWLGALKQAAEGG